jgi:RNA polymerase sigma factor (sigma-70 family)
MSDEEIIKGFRNTNFPLLQRLIYMRYETRVANLCFSFVKDRALAAELTQDIFLKVFSNFQRFRHHSTFSTWLYSVSKNHCIDFIRKKHKNPVIQWMPYAALPEIIDDIHSDSGDSEFIRERFTRALCMLPEKHRQVIEMRFLQKKSLKQMQNELGLLESAVKMRIQRAKKAILANYQSISQRRNR